MARISEIATVYIFSNKFMDFMYHYSEGDD